MSCRRDPGRKASAAPPQSDVGDWYVELAFVLSAGSLRNQPNRPRGRLTRSGRSVASELSLWHAFTIEARGFRVRGYSALDSGDLARGLRAGYQAHGNGQTFIHTRTNDSYCARELTGACRSG